MLASRYWAVSLVGASVASTNVSLTASAAIIDTGSTAITVGAMDGIALHEVTLQNGCLSLLC